MSNERTCQCGQAHGACTTAFQYAVKIVCGVVVATPGGASPVVAPGQYWTATNIHNPDKCKAANIRWKVAVAEPGKAGIVTAYQTLRPLQPDMAIEIDCPQIMQVIPQQPPTPFVKGYVVIESDIELDVVAVYSGAQAAGGTLNSFHTERVQPRCVPVCEDLVLPLHTGVMGWQTTSPTSGPVALVAGSPPAPFGTSVVSQLATDWTSPNPANLLIYELCFDLCFGFQMPTPFQIQGFANDSAQVFLNGTSIGNLPNSPTTLTVTSNILQSLQAGRNCFQVRVSNLPSSTTGFAIAGILRVIRGKCPCSPLPIAP